MILLHRSFLVLCITLIVCSCENSNQSKSSETSSEENQLPENTTAEQLKRVTSNSDQSVEDFLTEKGFMISSNGKTVYREDQLADVDVEKINSSIASLQKDEEANQQAIFYLKIAGSALDDDKSSIQFIKQNLADKDYLVDLDKMVKFTQRQDRPMIKKAILNTVSVMTTTQCADYLKFIGYVKGSNISNTIFNPSAIKGMPLFLKLALFNKLKSSDEDQETMIYVHMKQDLGVQG